MKFRSILLILALACTFGSSQLRAQDSNLKKEIASALEKNQKGLADAIAKIIQQRLAKIEAQLTEKNARISALEKRLAALAKKAEPKKAEPKKAEPKKAAPENGFLGVGHIEHEKGARINTVQESSPAANAKLKAGDIIVAINDEKVTSLTLGPAVKKHKAGSEITITYVRGDKRLTTKAKLVDRDAFYAAREARGKEKKPESIVLGVTVEEDAKGVFAYEVEEGFTGHAAGLKKNDRITHVGGKPVKTLDEIEAAVKKVSVGQELKLRIQNAKETVEIVVVGASKKGAAKLKSRKAIAKKKDEPKKDTPKAAAKAAGFLGVAVEATTTGLKVTHVVPNSCAAAYGLEADDVLTKVAGKAVKGVDSLIGELKGRKAGDTLAIEYRRGDKTSTISLVLGERDKAFKKPSAKKPDAPKKADPKKADPKKADPKKADAPKKATPKKRGTLGLQARETNDNHVLITLITPGGAAEKAGLKAGDIVLKIGDKSIGSFNDLYDVLKSLHADETVTLRVRRGDKEMDVQLKLGAPLSAALGY
jgi:S1-C subfamily serine protease